MHTTTPWIHGTGGDVGLPAGSFADGAPPSGGWADGTARDGYGPGGGYDNGAASIPHQSAPGVVARATKAVSRIRSFEGPRGYSTRVSVALRHFCYLLTIVTCSGLTHWAFQPNQTWRMGGKIMLFSCSFMLVTAAVGSLLYADQRHQVIEQCRHFVFGIVCLPGAALALFMRLVSSAIDKPSAEGDMFVQVLTGNGMPLMFIAIVIIPAFVYAKYVFGGIRSTNRAALSDEESMATYMRQDGFQR